MGRLLRLGVIGGLAASVGCAPAPRTEVLIGIATDSWAAGAPVE
jgi:hypothetical protein